MTTMEVAIAKIQAELENGKAVLKRKGKLPRSATFETTDRVRY